MNTYFWFRRSRLVDKALILKEMDLAILREGGVHNLPIEALRMSCYIRGEKFKSIFLFHSTIQKQFQFWIYKNREILLKIIHLIYLLLIYTCGE